MTSSTRSLYLLATLALSLAAAEDVAAVPVDAAGNQQPVNQVQEQPMQTILIPIEGMSCMSCVARVTKTLKALSGVSDAEVSLADRNARVKFSPKEISTAQIVAAVKGLGYSVGAPTEVK